MSVVAISTLATFFSGEEKLIKSGENALKSNRLQSFVYDGSMGLIKGKVKASMKLKVYEFTVSCVILRSQVLFLIYRAKYISNKAETASRTEGWGK